MLEILCGAKLPSSNVPTSECYLLTTVLGRANGPKGSVHGGSSNRNRRSSPQPNGLSAVKLQSLGCRIQGLGVRIQGSRLGV